MIKINIIKKILIFISFILIGFFVGYMLASIGDKYDANYGMVAEMALIFFTVTASIILNIIIHELGHVFFGKISGYKLVLFRIGKYSLVVDENGKKVFKRLSIPGTGGQALMDVPGEIGEEYPYKLYNYGGALFNLIGVLISLVLIMTVEKSYIFEVFLIINVLIGIITAVTNVLPLSQDINNDGMNARKMSQSDEMRDVMFLSLRLSAMYRDGKDESELKKSEIDYLKNKEPFEYGDLDLILGAYYMLNKDLENAKKYYYASLDKKFLMGDIQKYAVQGDLIYINTLERNFEEVDRLWDTTFNKVYKKLIGKLINKYYIEYAIELIKNKNLEKAESIVKEYIYFDSTYAFKGQSKGVNKLMELAKKYNEENVNLDKKEI